MLCSPRLELLLAFPTGSVVLYLNFCLAFPTVCRPAVELSLVFPTVSVV